MRNRNIASVSGINLNKLAIRVIGFDLMSYRFISPTYESTHIVQ